MTVQVTQAEVDELITGLQAAAAALTPGMSIAAIAIPALAALRVVTDLVMASAQASAATAVQAAVIAEDATANVLLAAKFGTGSNP